MAEKPIFNDLKKELPLKMKVIKINDKEIEIKQYLPVNEKLNLITRVLQQVAQNEYPFVNPIQMDVYTTLEIIYAYSNIEFTKDEKENPADLYDELEKQEIANKIIAAIPETEYNFVVDGVNDTITAYYTYRNSVKGIIEDVTTDYKDLNLDATEIQQKLADPDNLALLKGVMEKLG